MKEFFNSKLVNTPKYRIDRSKVDRFISKFNIGIKRKNIELPIVLNDALDKVPLLNENEMNFVVQQAKKNGWDLSCFEDNYNTVSYKINEIKGHDQ